MSLDLYRVVTQVGNMIARLKAGIEERQRRLQHALEVIHHQAADLDSLQRKIASSKTTWLVAGLVDRIDQCYKAPPTPTDFTILATDGSHIDVDRHQSTRCYLINIGSVTLHYGSSPDAVLDSFPHLYSEDEELVIIAPSGAKGREQPIEGTLLGIKRGVEECSQLAKLAEELPPDSSSVALLDGSLILWSLEAYPEFVTEALLNRGFLSHVDKIKKANADKRLALASYISFPRSTDVINALRVALCPNDPLDTDRHCQDCETRDCDKVAGVRDRELFLNLLGEGERSALFISQSKIQKRYGEHQVYFFYLRMDDEIARIEIPRWVATDDSLLNLVHALVLDQCQRGHGYPVALSEAHEQAVVTAADRDNFWQLVASSLVDEHLPSLSSAKSQSKRTRWV